MKDLLQRAKSEIVQLRRTNEVLSAQVEVVHIFAAALGLHNSGGGYAPDVAWELQKEIDRLSEIHVPLTVEAEPQSANAYGNREFD